MLPILYEQYKPPPLPYFPSVEAINAPNMSNEEAMRIAVIGAMASAVVPAIFAGLPIDLIRNFIRRKKTIDSVHYELIHGTKEH
jgi:hypothetical protein